MCASCLEWVTHDLQACALFRKASCSKNHVEHIVEEARDSETGEVITTKLAKLKFIHHKNEKKDKHGPATLPLSPGMVEAFEVLEKAARHFAPHCPTLFSSINKETYSEPYFSQYSKQVLSSSDTQVRATDMRHEFSTAWRDFMDNPGTAVQGISTTIVEGAAAHLMGNSSAAWDATYDDHMRTRALDRIIAMYPRFREFVKGEHARKRQQRPRDPHE